MAGELSAEQVKKIASLSGLSILDADCPAEAERLSSVLGHMACLAEFDLGGVKPLVQVGEEHSRLRADEPGATLDGDDSVGLAPASYESVDASGEASRRFFRVPKVLGDGAGGSGDDSGGGT